MTLNLEDIENEINSLHRKGLVSLEEPTDHKEDFIGFLSPKNSLWFWIIIATSFLSFVSIMFIPETGNTLVLSTLHLRVRSRSLLPGYCLTETLFPKETTLDIIERITFSIGLSFAITALVGLFLSFTPIGLTLAHSASGSRLCGHCFGCRSLNSKIQNTINQFLTQLDKSCINLRK